MKLLNKILYYIIWFLHHIVLSILYIYVILFSENFYLNIVILLILFLIVFLWYFLDVCLLVVIERYLLGTKYTPTEKYTIIKFFNYNLVLKHKKIYNSAVYIYLLLFIASIIKSIYLYKNKKCNIKIN
jgi:hypothetical protein